MFVQHVYSHGVRLPRHEQVLTVVVIVTQCVISITFFADVLLCVVNCHLCRKQDRKAYLCIFAPCHLSVKKKEKYCINEMHT